MKLSPVQLVQSQFVKVSVEHKDRPKSDEADDAKAIELDIEHTMHIERHSEDDAEKDATDSPCNYLLALGIRSGEDKNDLLSYTFELVVTAVVSVDPTQFLPGNNPNDSAAKFGFSIIYEQIREMLTTLTGRMNASVRVAHYEFYRCVLSRRRGNFNRGTVIIRRPRRLGQLETCSSRRISAMDHPDRPLIWIGRIAPFSRIAKDQH